MASGLFAIYERNPAPGADDFLGSSSLTLTAFSDTLPSYREDPNERDRYLWPVELSPGGAAIGHVLIECEPGFLRVVDAGDAAGGRDAAESDSVPHTTRLHS
jgi:hypothetical protein